MLLKLFHSKQFLLAYSVSVDNSFQKASCKISWTKQNIDTNMNNFAILFPQQVTDSPKVMDKIWGAVNKLIRIS